MRVSVRKERGGCYICVLILISDMEEWSRMVTWVHTTRSGEN